MKSNLIISHDIRKIAELMLYASDLHSKLYGHIEQIEDMVNEKDAERYFDPKTLAFSAEGLAKIKKIDNYLASRDILGVLSRIDKAISTGAVEDPRLKILDKYMTKALRRPGKWVYTNLSGLEVSKAIETIKKQALIPLHTALKALQNPKETELEEQRYLTPEDFAKHNAPAFPPEKDTDIDEELQKSLKMRGLAPHPHSIKAAQKSRG